MACASVSPSYHSLRSNLKVKSLRRIGCQRYEVRQLNGVWEKSCKSALGDHKSKSKLFTRQHVSFASSEEQDELSLDSLEPEKSNIEPDYVLLERSYGCPSERTAGKPGFISFHSLPVQIREEIIDSTTNKEIPKFVWFIGPTVLVAFLVFPSLYLRGILSTIFEDSLLTDFLILFFTEALFYSGAAIFFFLVDYIWRPSMEVTPSNKDLPKAQFGFRISSVATLLLSLLIPSVTIGMVWPWTGPAASATLAPYLVGLVVQFGFERYARHQKSPALSIIPVIFQVYRLHQLNRAVQLVTALSFSVRGAETASQSMAINRSLGTLLTVLQILGVICIWSLSSFLMRFVPSSQVIPES